MENIKCKMNFKSGMSLKTSINSPSNNSLKPHNLSINCSRYSINPSTTKLDALNLNKNLGLKNQWVNWYQSLINHER